MNSTLPLDLGGTVEISYKDARDFAFYAGYDSDRYRWPEFIGPEIGAEEMN